MDPRESESTMALVVLADHNNQALAPCAAVVANISTPKQLREYLEARDVAVKHRTAKGLRVRMGFWQPPSVIGALDEVATCVSW